MLSLFILKHICIPKKTVSSPWLSISEGCRILNNRQGLHLRGSQFRNGFLFPFLSSSHRLQHIAYISVLQEALQSSESNTSLRFTVCKTPSAKDSVGYLGQIRGTLHWEHTQAQDHSECYKQYMNSLHLQSSYLWPWDGLPQRIPIGINQIFTYLSAINERVTMK